MKPSWVGAFALFLILCVAHPRALLCQDDSARETYNGEPVYHVIGRGGVTVPRATYDPDPEYDDEDRKKNIEGMVLLSVIVTKDGRTADIKITKSLTPGLDKQAIKAVSQWRFDPATKDGQPVAVRLVIETVFHIR